MDKLYRRIGLSMSVSVLYADNVSVCKSLGIAMEEIARVKTVLTGWSGAPGISTNFFQKRTGLSWDTYGAQMVTRVQDAWTELAPYIPNSVTVTTEGTIDILSDSTGEVQQTLAAEAASHTGTSATGLLPTASALVVTWRTPGVVAGRHVRGRTFISPITANAVDFTGTPDAAFLALASTFASTLRGTGGEAVVPIIWARPKPAPNTDPQTWLRFGSQHLITEATIRDKFAVLRSRRD